MDLYSLGGVGFGCGCVLGSIGLQRSVLVVTRVWADESACVSARYAAEVCEWHGHLGSCDAVRVVDERVGEAHPEAFGRTLTILGAAHAELAELRAIQSWVEDTEAAGVTTCSVAQSSLIVSQCSTVERLQRREIRRIQATHVSLTAHGRHAVTQSWRRRGEKNIYILYNESKFAKWVIMVRHV